MADINRVKKKLALHGFDAVHKSIFHVHEKSEIGNLSLALAYLMPMSSTKSPPEDVAGFMKKRGQCARQVARGGGKTKKYNPSKQNKILLKP